MAKIAVELKQALTRREADGAPGETTARALAEGDGWSVSDVVCTSGPRDRAFEEQHSEVRIAVVVAGSFEYRAAVGQELMTPGSVLLGREGQYFECSHEHGAGDRCIAFGYSPDYFSRLAADGGCGGTPDFRMLRLPPLRAASPLVARACAALTGSAAGGVSASWEELSFQLAALTLRFAAGPLPGARLSPPGAVARVTRTVRKIEDHPDGEFTLGSLARDAGLSPYHFLRVFERLTGVTPHQYVLRTRLRQAAMRVAVEPTRVIDIALDCGFGDVSNFNRAFRAEFGASPSAFRRQIGMPRDSQDSN